MAFAYLGKLGLELGNVSLGLFGRLYMTHWFLTQGFEYDSVMDKPFIPDHPEDALWIFLGALVALTAVAATTNLDSEFGYFLNNPADFMSSPDSDNGSIVFSESQAGNLNWASQRSLGFSAVADERLYCFELKEDSNVVDTLVPVDNLEGSNRKSVEGKCFSSGDLESIDGFIHTQPDYNGELSEEDKSMESQVPYTCIQSAEIADGLQGDAKGLSCWKVEYGFDGEAESFTEIEVVVG